MKVHLQFLIDLIPTGCWSLAIIFALKGMTKNSRNTWEKSDATLSKISFLMKLLPCSCLLNNGRLLLCDLQWTHTGVWSPFIRTPAQDLFWHWDNSEHDASRDWKSHLHCGACLLKTYSWKSDAMLWEAQATHRGYMVTAQPGSQPGPTAINLYAPSRMFQPNRAPDT